MSDQKLYKMQIGTSEMFMKRSFKNWAELYPAGSVVKTLKDVIDPFKTEKLPEGSFVTIKKLDTEITKKNYVWILCEDKNKNEWNVKSVYLETFRVPKEKKGRFRILAQEMVVDKNKESVCQKK